MEDATTTLIVLKELAGHSPTSLDPIQQFIMSHYSVIHACWVVLWFVTAAVLLGKLGYEYTLQKKSG